MSKIYKRTSLIKNTIPNEKNRNRKRNTILNFRVSLEEKEMINSRIKLSGLGRQDFFIQSCLHQKIIVYGNVKTFEEIKAQIKIIDQHLMQIAQVDELDAEKLESLRTVLEILNGFARKE